MVRHPNQEGSIEAPTRYPIEWQSSIFRDENSLFSEMERVYDICHGCRRCVSLCQAFPTLFDLVDESATMEVDGIKKEDYWKVVDQCYLCDLCYMTKCPYVPPHEWNVDFPHLMLRAKAARFEKTTPPLRDRIITSTDKVGQIAGIPIIVNCVNTANRSNLTRKLLQRFIGIDARALLPTYYTKTARRQLRKHKPLNLNATSTERTTGKVAVFTTCYGNYNSPEIVKDLVTILEHNQIPTTLVDREKCCGMPKLELGDLKAVSKQLERNQQQLIDIIDDGWDIIAPVPSCILMFKQELPLLFPDNQELDRIRSHWFDPFEYLFLRQKDGLFNTKFVNGLGKIAYHAACHQRVQNIGPRTRQILELIPNTKVVMIERCSGHDGTYAVKKETHEASLKIARPVINRIIKEKVDYYGSDCPIAAQQFQNGIGDGSKPTHPISLLRQAYGV